MGDISRLRITTSNCMHLFQCTVRVRPPFANNCVVKNVDVDIIERSLKINKGSLSNVSRKLLDFRLILYPIN